MESLNIYKYQAFSKIKERFAISAGTLRLWSDAGEIQCVRMSPQGKRLYNVSSIEQHLGYQKNTSIAEAQKKCISYARVSSTHQKEDLQADYPTHQVVQDIGSGLNFTREGLRSILELVFRGLVAEIVVAHKDRLCRYGAELLEFIFKTFGTELVVYSRQTDPGAKDDARELANDLLAVTTVFVARNNGRRSAVNQRKRKQRKQNEAAKRNKARNENA
jgi:putative resolvase